MTKEARETLFNQLIQDYTDVIILPPSYPFAYESNWPNACPMGALINHYWGEFTLDEKKLIKLEEYIDEPSKQEVPFKEADLAATFTYRVLEGFGHETSGFLEGSGFSGLSLLANTFGTYWAREVVRLFRRYEAFQTLMNFTLDIFPAVYQAIPAKQIGEAIRESTTPAYLRAGELVTYSHALFSNDRLKMDESQSILRASDRELESLINDMFFGISTTQVGRQMQIMLTDASSQLEELFSSDEFKQHYDQLPMAINAFCQNICWNIGHRLALNLMNDKRRTERLLEAISQHQEISAAFEQFQVKNKWGGNSSGAVRLGWQALAPMYFHLSGRPENISEDSHQEKLIGVAQGLNDYTKNNTATAVIKDGLSGYLGSYLTSAANHEETDFARKQTTDGNRILTEAKHTSDLCHANMEADSAFSDEELLSREREKHHPSGNPVGAEAEARELYSMWEKSLTGQERKACKLMQEYDDQRVVAGWMGISQQRCSQLLLQAKNKLNKIINTP